MSHARVAPGGVALARGGRSDIGNVFTGDNRGAALHWLNQGLPVEARRGSASFDPGYYRNAFIDLANAFGSDYVALLAHWVEHGKREGRRAVP